MAPYRCGKDHDHRAHPFLYGKSHKIGEVHEGASDDAIRSRRRERGITITSAATNRVLERQAA